MTKRRSARLSWLSAILLLMLAFPTAPTPLSAIETETEAPPAYAVSGPRVALRGASGAIIPFASQNGWDMGNVPSQRSDVPHLVLYRNGTLAVPDERTLIVELTGIEIPPAGVTVTLRVETQHGDPDLGDRSDRKIPVWRESRWIAPSAGATQAGGGAAFRLEFGKTVRSGGEEVATPTDYFRYDVTVTDVGGSPADPPYTWSQDYAFLMENQWIAPLPEVGEASPGAAPDELVVYYCDMFPFQKNLLDPSTWLPREEVTGYVGTELVPRMVEAYRTQTDEWGFPWYDEWTSYRPEEPERLTVALVEGQTWFHGKAPVRGHAGISTRVTGRDNAAYDTLTDGLMANFHHELFHNLQRNIHLHSGGNGEVDGGENAWKFYSEGTAVLASAVGQPRGQFSRTLQANSYVKTYMSYANSFVLSGGGASRDLNTSYEELYPYRAALYWRFLYEQCGGMRDGAEDPAAGMRVIRRALTALYSGQIVDIGSSDDLVGTLPQVMDRALAGSSCPFQTYSQSVVAFARALYGLRLDGGRCGAPGIPAGCGFYDPHYQYVDPPLTEITYAGVRQAYRNGIAGSFGIDLIEVALDPAADGQPLRIEFYGPPGSGARFDVQLLPLLDPAEGKRARRIPAERAAALVRSRSDLQGHQFYTIPAIDTAACNKLGLIITRLDAHEASDPVGEYTIVLRPGV